MPAMFSIRAANRAARCSNRLRRTIAGALSVLAVGAAGFVITAAPASAAVPVVTVDANPSAVSAVRGTSATFTVACSANEGATVQYQWQYSTTGAGWFNVFGGTNPTLTIDSVQQSLLYRAMCYADGSLRVFSNEAYLTMTAIPVITITDPAPASVTAGQPAAFTAACTSVPAAEIGYQWQVSTDGTTFTAIDGATTAEYTITATATEQSGAQYRAVCSAPGAEPVTSGPASLTVTAPVPVITVVTNPISTTVLLGTPVTLVTACTATEGATVRYQWQYSSSNGASWETLSSGYDRPTLFLGFPEPTPSGLFRVLCSAPGAEPIYTEAAQVRFISTPVITVVTAPSPQSVTVGRPATFAVDCTAAQAVTVAYQWEASSDGTGFAPIDGATAATYNIAATTLAQNGSQYRAVCSAPLAASVTTAAATLAVTPVPVITVVTDTTTPDTQAFTAACTATEGAVVSYQWELSTDGGLTFAPIVGETSDTYLRDFQDALPLGRLYRVVCSAPNAEPVASTAVYPPSVNVVTLRPTSQSVAAGQPATFTAACRNTQGTPIAYQWQVSTDGGFNAGGTYADIPGATSGTYTTGPTTLAQNGSLYRLACFAPNAGTFFAGDATLTVTAPAPVITVATNPSPQSVTAGQPATFTAPCSVTEGAAVSYQWQVSTNSGQSFSPVADATSATYTTAATALSQNGSQYRVACSAPGATSVTSAAATLSVAAPATAYTVTILSPTAGSTVKAGALVPVQIKITGPNGKRLTSLQGLVLTLTCGARVSINSQATSCAIYNPLTGNFTALATAPTALTNGADAPITATMVSGGRTLATATTTVAVRR